MLLYCVAAIIAVLIPILDQISKYFVESGMQPGDTVDLIPGVLRLQYVINTKGMMGLFRENRWAFLVLSVLVVAGIVTYFAVRRPRSRVLCISLSLILGGGIGNLVDRIIRPDGGVVDFVDFYAFPEVWHYIFNVADIFVCVGVGLMFFYLIRDMVRDAKKEKLEKARNAAEAKNSQEPQKDKNPSEDSHDGV